MKKQTIRSLVTLALLLLVPSTTLAASPGFALRLGNVDSVTGYTNMDIPSGKEGRETIFITNTDDKQSIDVNLTIEPPEGIGVTDAIPKNWVVLASDKITILPKEEKKVEFSVKVPEGSSPKTFRGLVVATMVSYGTTTDLEAKPKKNQNDSSKVQVKIASSANLKVNVVEPNAKLEDKSVGKSQDTAKSFDLLSFLQNNALWAIAALIILIGIAVIIRKASDNKGKESKGKK